MVGFTYLLIFSNLCKYDIWTGAMTYEPKSYMFYFGLHESVRSLFNEPGFPEDIFCDSRISEQTQPGSFFLGMLT